MAFMAAAENDSKQPLNALAYLQVIRPLNCLMSAFAVYITTLVAGLPVVPSVPVILGMLSVFLICAGGMVVNDYFDIDIDRINRPKRPLPSGKISPRSALVYAAVLFLAGIALSYFVSFTALAIAASASALLVFYSWQLKKKLLVGHAAVSLLTAMTFVYGGAIATSFSAVAYLALLAFLSSLGREIFKSIEDVLGDKTARVGSLAVKYGANRARIFAGVPLMAAVVLSFVPFLAGIFGMTYLYFVSAADLMFLAAMAVPVKFSAKLCKFAMLAALLAFLAGAVAK